MAKTNDNTRKKDAAKNDNFIMKVIGFFKGFGLKIGRAFKDMWAELKNVTWPQRSELINYSLVVLAFMLVMGIVIFLIDAAAGALIQSIT